MREVSDAAPPGPRTPPSAAQVASALLSSAPVSAADRSPADPPAPPVTGFDDVLDRAMAALRGPGLVVLHGGPGSGRSTALRRLGTAFRGPVLPGGGLAMLRAVPGFALSRAVRARLPVHDGALLVEAVRSRVRHGLLLLDDLQWVDPGTVAAVADLARYCRVAVALRTPHRIDVTGLHAVATAWLRLPELSDAHAGDLVRRVAPGLSAVAVARVVRRAGGVPLAVEVLAGVAARTASDGPGSDPAPSFAAAPRPADPAEDVTGPDGLAYAVAGALADLPRPARTALAALGLLGRPAAPALLGGGLPDLVDAGLVRLDRDPTGPDLAAPSLAAPVCPYVAEVAAGLLDADARRALHRRLADLVPPREAVRHLAAAGESRLAYDLAVAAAGRVRAAGERAELLVLACDLPGVAAEDRVRLAAATDALRAGWPRDCLRILAGDPRPAALILCGEAHLQLGDPVAAMTAVPRDAGDVVRAGRDRLLLLGRLATDPPGALAAAAVIESAATAAGPPAGLAAALAAVRAAGRVAGWERALAAAARAAAEGGDPLSARWSGWLLVETLAADGRLAEAARAAAAGAAACAADLAYSWQTRFLAAQLWCAALRGDATDEVLRRAGDLTDRMLPALARGYASAAAGLAEADGGLLAAARARLAAAGAVPGGAAAVLDWVAREAAWLDGQPDPSSPPRQDTAPLVDGLHRITARWAAYDAAGDGGDGEAPGGAAAPPVSSTDTEAVRATLQAWAGRDPAGFDRAARAWHDLVPREEVRCLLAYGLREADPRRAVPPLLRAERIAESAGMVVLLGRTRRALRRHAVRRDQRGPRCGAQLSGRERQVLRAVAHGEPTRRIAGQLGISRETVETHIRSGMRKLGARTRTEAAAIALEVLG